MSRPFSTELKDVINEAYDSAEQLGQELNTVHLLFGLFMTENSGELLFNEEHLSDEMLTPFVATSGKENEEAPDKLVDMCEEVAGKYRGHEVNCLHLVVALCSKRDTKAFSVLEQAGIRTLNLRNHAVSLLVNPLPPRYKALLSKRKTEENAQPMPESQPRRAKVAVTETIDATAMASLSANGKSTTSTIASTAHPSARPPLSSKELGKLVVLPEVATDLCALAEEGLIDPAFGRMNEMSELSDILNKRRANNPLLLGESGVGKTALIEGLAVLLAFAPDELPALAGRRIFRLETAKMLKGTHLRGSFSERIEALQREIAAADGRIILFIDDFHQLVKGSTDGSQEIASELRNALARGTIPCIAATTLDEFRQSIEKDPGLLRVFHTLELEEPNEPLTIRILSKAAPSYAEHHGIEIPEEIIHLIVRLTNRYMRDKHQPDKALNVLDLAAARCARAGFEAVNRHIVAEVISLLMQIPVDQIITDETSRYLSLETQLGKKIIGHRTALKKLAESLRRNVAGFAGDRPMGSFLFIGPTGVGKTEAAKALAEELFGSRDALVRFDMSEFSESHSVAKLIGAPPGYVGFSDGGAMTDSVRRKPFQIILLDEIEKAHHDVHQLLLQLLDDGRLSDSKGHAVDFTNTIIIMTSNMGSEAFDPTKQPIGFSDEKPDAGKQEAEALKAVQRTFAPELYNRIDEKIIFGSLSEAEVREIANHLLEKSSRKLLMEKKIRMQIGDAVGDVLVAKGGFEPRFGARPMRRTIQKEIETPIATMVLLGEATEGDLIKIEVAEDGNLQFNKQQLQENAGELD